jgi:hypothetical protein
MLLARRNKDCPWVQIATNFQQDMSSKEAEKMIQWYLNAGYELQWCTFTGTLINSDNNEDLARNEVEDSQNDKL